MGAWIGGGREHSKRARWRASSLACALPSSLAALAVAVPALGESPALGSSEAHAAVSRYCADQRAVFTDKHAYLGVSDPYVAGGLNPPRGLSAEQYRNCSFGRMAAGHIGLFRAGMPWIAAEPSPNVWSWTVQDALVSDLARHHMSMLAVLSFPPPWAAAASPVPHCQAMNPPANDALFAQFAALAVQRYGRGGSFWRANPSLPYYPVTAWQVWNEPNLRIFWGCQPDARAYAQLLRLTYRAIKGIDRHATVVMAGEPYATRYSPASSFYTLLYKAGARGTFDALALHDYAPGPQQAILRLQVVRGIMNKFHDAKTPLWVTEMGWSTAGPPPPISPTGYIAGVNGQRSNLVAFFKSVQKLRSRLRLGPILWYGWRDVDWRVVSSPGDYWGYHTSFFTWAMQPKPALASYLAFARTLDR